MGPNFLAQRRGNHLAGFRLGDEMPNAREALTNKSLAVNTTIEDTLPQIPVPTQPYMLTIRARERQRGIGARNREGTVRTAESRR